MQLPASTLLQRQMVELHRCVTAAVQLAQCGERHAQVRRSWRVSASGTASPHYLERPVQPDRLMQLQYSGPSSHLAQRYHDAAKLRRRHNYQPQLDQAPLLPEKQPHQQQEQQQWRPSPPAQVRQPGEQAAAAAAAAAPSEVYSRRFAEAAGPSQLQLAQQPQQHRPMAAFGQWLSFCELYARSEQMLDWHRAAHGLESLVRAASSPLQAQQAWQVALLLQGRPLHISHARRLGGAVVSLVELTLRNHDHSLLRQLMGHSPRFALSRRHVRRLISAAAAADVGLEDLQVLLDMLHQAALSAPMFFALIKSFMQRQQYPEAAHCFHKMQAAGLPMSPALQAMQEQLRTRSSSSLSNRG